MDRVWQWRSVFLRFALIAAVCSASMAGSSTNKLANGFNDLGFDILRTLAKTNLTENLLISPLSLGCSLALLDQAASAEADAELQKILHTTGMKQPEIRAESRALRSSFIPPRLDPKSGLFNPRAAAFATNFVLDIAQSIWVDKRVQPADEFISISRNDFASDIQACDFRDRSVCDLINRWVSEKTRGKIRMVPCPAAHDVPVALVNAVYFKDIWLSQFDPKDTAKQKFHGATGTTTVNMMKQRFVTSYAHKDGVTYVTLAYRDAPYAIDVVMPSGKNGLERFVSTATVETFERILAAEKIYDVTLKLPRFEFEKQADLMPPLERLGLKKCRERAYKPLPGISPEAELQSVGQSTYIKVDEKGSEAAAVTHMIVATVSAEPPPPPPRKNVTIDHPFLFTIRHRSNALLFLGIVQDLPEAN